MWTGSMDLRFLRSSCRHLLQNSSMTLDTVSDLTRDILELADNDITDKVSCGGSYRIIFFRKVCFFTILLLLIFYLWAATAFTCYSRCSRYKEHFLLSVKGTLLLFIFLVSFLSCSLLFRFFYSCKWSVKSKIPPPETTPLDSFVYIQNTVTTLCNTCTSIG